MNPYRAPVTEMWFVMSELAGLGEVMALPEQADSGEDVMHAVLEEAARFSGAVLAPLNRVGDQQPSTFASGAVETTPGFREAYARFTQAGWQGLAHPRAYGGQQLPKLVASACSEMINAANLSFALCPLLTDGAIEALLTAGSPALIAAYVPKLVEGRWTGTMNLTEAQAGSDLSLVRTRAEPCADGSYRLVGTKIYITYGEHDLAENIVHLVLARTPDAPAGVKGLSLFVVPKFLPSPDGTPGARNDVYCLSLEHKLGIRASPTAVLQYGEHGGATGYLVGAEHAGLQTMFIMMNAARFAVGIQGIGVADRAYQQAVAYARLRVQGRPADGSAGQAVPIIRHPDVRRMLATMRALTEGARALAYVAAAHSDRARGAADAAAGRAHQSIYEFLVPIVKGWSTELAVEVASLGIQVHGGMGYIEETGAAQYYRDARILSIYEGTTAIQANDLIGRKTLRDGGATARRLLDEVAAVATALADSPLPDAQALAPSLRAGHRALSRALQYVLDTYGTDPNAVLAGGVPFLKLAGIVLGGWQMARALLVAQRKLDGDTGFYRTKIATARCFGDHILSQASGLAVSIAAANSRDGVLALDDADF